MTVGSGNVVLTAGGTSHKSATATGGEVYLSAGTAAAQTGGRVLILSGVNTAGSSGALGVGRTSGQVS